MLEKSSTDYSWDFKKSNTKDGNHGFHTYPAMIIPPVAKRLIDEYGKDSKHICDPFMGSGTVLVEAKLSPNFQYAYGIDINPLAILIAKVKTTPINPKLLESGFKQIIDNFLKSKEKYIENKLVIDIPEIQNLDYWFKQNVISDLALLKNSIEIISNSNEKVEENLKNFFNASFSETVRLVSNTRNSEFKLYRMAPEQLSKFEPNTIQTFIDKTAFNIERMNNFYMSYAKCKIRILNEDSRSLISIPSDHFNLMITSPPYGDSKTTVAYGQFSRLSLEWLNFEREETRKIDNCCLGGKNIKSQPMDLESPTLYNILDEIRKIDEKRANEVKKFYTDFYICLNEIDRIMQERSTLCFVVGNRRIKGVTIPTDEIIVELLQSFENYQHHKTIIRNIHNKRMPHQNSPTNIKGNLETTMNKEYIVVLKKQ